MWHFIYIKEQLSSPRRKLSLFKALIYYFEHTCVCVQLCALHGCRSPERPEECITFPGIGAAGSCESPCKHWEQFPRSFVRTVRVLNHWPIAPKESFLNILPYHNFFPKRLKRSLKRYYFNATCVGSQLSSWSSGGRGEETAMCSRPTWTRQRVPGYSLRSHFKAVTNVSSKKVHSRDPETQQLCQAL